MRARSLPICLILAIGCGDDAPSQATAPAPGPIEEPAVIDAAPGPVVTPFDGGADEPAALDALGAVPAWQAVIDRDRYLARRHHRGAVFGRITAPIDDQRWLVDDTEGAGTLGIRVDLPDRAEVEPGQRLLTHGAWITDDAHHWVWRADRVERLAPAAEPLPDFDPTRELTTTPAPEGAVPVSQASGAGPILFDVVASPRRLGTGWDIADPGTTETAAILLLPGEHEPYGAQDLTSSDEHWQLRQKTTYTVEVQRFRRRGDRTPTLRATGAPRIVE